MMTPELFVFLFAALGVYTTAGVWFRTAEERRIQQERARGQRDGSSEASDREPASFASSRPRG